MSKFIFKNPTKSSHVIVIEESEGSGSLFVPIFINGVASYFTCQKPTRSEYEYGYLPITDFSAEAPDWDPLDLDYA